MKSFLEHVEALRKHTLDLAKSANLSINKPSALKTAKDAVIEFDAQREGYNLKRDKNSGKFTTPQNPKDPGSQLIPLGQITHSLKPTLSPEQIEAAAQARIPARREYRKQKLASKKLIRKPFAEQTSRELTQLSKINKEDLKEYPGKKGEKYHHALHKLIGRMTKNK